MEVVLKKGKQCSDNLLEIKVYRFRSQNIAIRALPLIFLLLFNFCMSEKKILVILL